MVSFVGGFGKARLLPVATLLQFSIDVATDQKSVARASGFQFPKWALQ